MTREKVQSVEFKILEMLPVHPLQREMANMGKIFRMTVFNADGNAEELEKKPDYVRIMPKLFTTAERGGLVYKCDVLCRERSGLGLYGIDRKSVEYFAYCNPGINVGMNMVIMRDPKKQEGYCEVGTIAWETVLKGSPWNTRTFNFTDEQIKDLKIVLMEKSYIFNC